MSLNDRIDRNEETEGDERSPAVRRKREPRHYPQEGVAVTCRSFREYEAMFALEETRLARGAVLNVAGGASSFTAEAAARGYEAFAADPRYAKTPDELYRESAEEIAASTSKLERLKDKFDWSFYGSLTEHRINREASLERFIDHYRSEAGRSRNRGRDGDRRPAYTAAALPELPFPDETFELVLCSHFLFLYEEQFPYEFHRDALLELYRVVRPGGEIRIYPVYSLRFAKYARLDELLRTLTEDRGAAAELLPSRLPFLPGSTELLKIAKPTL
ncbi:methyltransferase domain-containing protein [Paenibacillus sp.]|uniref:methyltransferase domain-containing protein n=1 Tax=Paenibacillus sp. TaxID=58172 RepID=UPI002D49527D|nr:methyltransferase domain-containing protein [Paenibacillus sp.]HZG87214.1 methyltransferase domain-containing protein [Paenibacillus sp.]